MVVETIRTICQFCHTNCGLLLHRSANGWISIKGDPGHPMNRGRCCPKAAANAEIVHATDRLLHPLWKDASARGIRTGGEVEVTSPQGRITLRAEVTEGTKPGLVQIDFGWGNPTDGMADINLLVNDQCFDPVSEGTPNRLFPCEVKARSDG